MLFCWRATDDPTLNTGLVFQRIRISTVKKPFIFVIFMGGPDPPPPLLPSGSTLVMKGYDIVDLFDLLSDVINLYDYLFVEVYYVI